MTIKEVLPVLGTILGVGAMFGIIPFIMFVVFPFFQSLSPEGRFEKFVHQQCLQGNEIAILIRRDGTRFYRDQDFKLARAAIEGNEHAIRALKLDSESHKKRSY